MFYITLINASFVIYVGIPWPDETCMEYCIHPIKCLPHHARFINNFKGIAKLRNLSGLAIVVRLEHSGKIF